MSEENFNATSSESSSSHIEPRLRTLMEEFYSPFNKELVDVLQDSKFDWGY